MVYKEHLVELWVNKKKVELESQENLNIRFNNILLDPTKISSTQAEYSFEFELPCTPVNNKIFDYANNLSKLNKFHSRWTAELYADGNLIFRGTLTLNSCKDNHYHANLVSIKNNTLDELFGEEVMSDITLFNGNHWDIPFDGAGSSGSTIDFYNDAITNRTRNDVCFPLVSYGAFQKSPSGTTTADDDEDTLKTYTSKFDLDKYNRWYVESFYPSISMLETMKKCYEYKGFSVAGDAFQDTFLKDVFMSVNLADGQTPIYNLGNPKFGEVSLSATLSTSGKSYYQQELNYPYFKVSGPVADEYTSSNQQEYNYASVFMYDILADGQVTVNAPSYMYQPNEKVIVILADGFYKVEMTVSSTLNTSGSLNVMHHLYSASNREMYEDNVTLGVGFRENTPIEVALVRNYKDSYELIKGKKNKNYTNGNPNDTSANNVNEWLTCFPHEDAYNATLPTKQNDLALYNTQGRRRPDGSVSEHVGQRRGSTISGRHTDGDGFNDDSKRRWTPVKLGYVYNDGEIMAYDQAVSKSFVCGFSSFYGGVASVMKNGYSWSKSESEEQQAFYPEIGYSFMRRTEDGGTSFEETQYNYNTYINTPVSYVNVNNQGTSMNGFISCMVYLKKDDVL